MASIGILGGGIAGLSAAFYLKQLLPTGSVARVILLEASPRLGGWMQSFQHPDGAVMELGPRTLRATGVAGANTIALAYQLGLEGMIQAVPYGHPTTQNRMIKVDGQLHKLPSSFQTAIKKIPPFSQPLIMSVMNELRAPKIINNDESLYSFVNRRFGREVASYIIDPLARGVFAGNARDLSVKSLGKILHAFEQDHGGVVRGAVKQLFIKKKKKEDVLDDILVQKARKEKWAVWSLKGGIENLVRTLADRVIDDGVTIKLNSKVDGLAVSNSGIDIKCGSDLIKTDHIISCIPSNQLAMVIGGINPDLKPLLGFTPYATVGVVTLEYSGNLISQPAFGYLVPSTEQCKVLGVIFDTCTFPQSNRTLLTVMMGGYWFESLFGPNPSPDILLAAAVEEVTNTLGIKEDPSHSKVSVLRDCIPQYVVGHEEAVGNARRLLKQLKVPLHLAGNSYDGVGVNDAIISAKNAVMQIPLL